MVDVFSKRKRSQIMSAVKSKWTKPEKKAHAFLKGHKIPHKMYPKIAPGADILLLNSNTAILLHGCFWHGCKKHYKAPKSNVDFWKKKLVINQKRDTKVKSRLKKLGFKVVVVWGHELDSNFEKAMDKMLKKVS